MLSVDGLGLSSSPACFFMVTKRALFTQEISLNHKKSQIEKRKKKELKNQWKFYCLLRNVSHREIFIYH